MNDTVSSRWRGSAAAAGVPSLPLPSGSVGGMSTYTLRTVRLLEQAQAWQGKTMGDNGAARLREPHFVPTLQLLCARVLAQHFVSVPELDALRDSGDVQTALLYNAVIEHLPLCAGVAGADDGVPLRVAVARVTDEAYWRRCCEARWSLGQLSRFASDDAPEQSLVHMTTGWKRRYLEHALCDFLQDLQLRRVSAAMSAGAAQAATLALVHTPQRMLYSGARTSSTRALHDTSAALASATTVVVEDAAGASTALGDGSASGDGDEGEDAAWTLDDADAATLHELCAVCRDYVTTVSLPCQRVHLPLHAQLCARLPLLQSLRVTYDARGAGVQYERQQHGFSRRDAHEVRQLLCHHPALRTLRLPGNKLSGECVTAIVAGVAVRNALHTLDLSCNALDDDDVARVALLLCDGKCALATLVLRDNRMTGAGARALAEAMTYNTTLRTLDVSQNRIDDVDGGDVLMRALAAHDALTHLDLSNNRLGGATVAALCDTLPRLRALTQLSLTGNAGIGASSTVALLPDAVAQCASLRRIDVRCCGVPADVQARLDALVRTRVRAAARA